MTAVRPGRAGLLLLLRLAAAGGDNISHVPIILENIGQTSVLTNVNKTLQSKTLLKLYEIFLDMQDKNIFFHKQNLNNIISTSSLHL